MVTFYRRLPKFDYVKPKSLDEALDHLASNKNGTFKIYAGGTDVIPKLKSRLINTPEVLMDLKGIPDLAQKAALSRQGWVGDGIEAM